MNYKVIATSWNEGREHRVPPAVFPYPDHYQNVDGHDDSLRRLKDIIKFENEQIPGAPYNLVIVRSGDDWKDGDDFLDKLNDTKFEWGTIYTIRRSNIGWSFGGYNAAYQKFKKDFGYWIFTEDDILVGGRNYFAKLIEKYNSKEGIGFVSLIKICRHSYGVHAGGGVGLTHSKILSQVDVWHKGLPHHLEPDDPTLDPRYQKDKIIQGGEVPFTHEILNLGFDLVSYGNEKEWNLESNLCLPYFNYQNALPKS